MIVTHRANKHPWRYIGANKALDERQTGDKVVSHGEDSQRVSRVMHGLYPEEGDQDHTLSVCIAQMASQSTTERKERSITVTRTVMDVSISSGHDAGSVSSSCDIRRQAFDLCGLLSA